MFQSITCGTMTLLTPQIGYVFQRHLPQEQHNVLQTAAIYRGADKSLARPGRKQTTATEDFEFRISYLYP